jgi:hypothetical protein
VFSLMYFVGNNHIQLVPDAYVPSPKPAVVVVQPIAVEPVDEWLYVQKDNVRLWPVVNGECSNKNALGQIHFGAKVLVIERNDPLIEITLNDLSLVHTHGCIHGDMLGAKNVKN